MKNIKNYITQLSNKDRALLFFSLGLLFFASFKFFLVDSLNKNNAELKSKSIFISEQEQILKSFQVNSNANLGSKSQANKVITSFLKQHSNSQNLKQIRTTNSGEQRFEIEDIEFSKCVDLLASLEKNGSDYSSIQIKERKKSGLINLIITIKS